MLNLLSYFWGAVQEYKPEKYILASKPESISYDQSRLIDKEIERRTQLEKDSREYAKIRKELSQFLPRFKKAPSDEKEINDIYRENVVVSRSELRRNLDKMRAYELKTEGTSERAERYEKFTEKRLDAFYSPIQEKADKELNEIISGKRGRITIQGVESGINRRLTFSRRERPSKMEIVGEGKKYIEQNLDKIPFISLKEIEKQGVTLVHGFPGYPGGRGIDFKDRDRLATNNPEGYKILHGGDISAEELASIVISKKPPLSAVSVTNATGDYKLFSPWGIILGGEGKVYDADNRDIVTMPYGNSKIRFAKFYHDSRPLHERVNLAVASSKSSSSYGDFHDEFSVGGNYDIRGIYFVPSRLTPETLESIVGFAKEKGLKAYEFKEDQFIEYEKPKVNSKRKIKK